MDVFCQVFYIYLYFTSTNAKENEAKLLNKKKQSTPEIPSFPEKNPTICSRKNPAHPYRANYSWSDWKEIKTLPKADSCLFLSFHFSGNRKLVWLWEKYGDNQTICMLTLKEQE